MKIKLTKTGGLIGKKMSAEMDWPHEEENWLKLVEQIKVETPDADERHKDAFYYTLQGRGEKFSLDPRLIPKKYEAFFQKLFDALKVE